MAEQIALLDTSVLIDHYRKRDKTKTFFFKLAGTFDSLVISAVTHFEIYKGVHSDEQSEFWDTFFEAMIILPFDVNAAKAAAKVDIELKRRSSRIDIPDLFIAATAISNNLPCATLNTKHFSRIASLQLIDPSMIGK